MSVPECVNQRDRRLASRLGTVSVLALACAMGAGAAMAQDKAAPGAAATSVLPEIVVTGSRVVKLGFTAPTPVTVVGADRAERLAITNTGELLNDLPSFRPTSTPATSNIQPSNAGMSLADLRGLGPVRTLVLVDGKRFVPSTLQGTVDMGLIPPILLDRVEVVTGGASAQYGSDAVAGVVNLILNKRLNGIRGDVSYGLSQNSDNRDYHIALAGGTSFLGDKGHVIGAVEFEDNGGVGSCYDRKWCALEYQDITQPGAPGANGFEAHNILPRAHTVTAVNGGIITSGPLKGTAFGAGGAPYAYQYGQTFAGNTTFMYGGAGDNGFIGAPDLIVPVRRYTAYTHANYDFTPDLTGMLELSYGDIRAAGPGAQTRDTGNLTLCSDNAYLPASVKAQLPANASSSCAAGNPASFGFGRMGDDLGRTANVTTSKTWRVVAGVNGKLPAGWTWDAYYQYGHDDYRQSAGNDRNNSLWNGQKPYDAVVVTPANVGTSGLTLGSIVCRTTLAAPTNGCVPINLFGPNEFSAAAKAYLYGTAWQATRFDQHVVAANIQGEPAKTWAGPISVAAGAEYRSNQVSTTTDPVSAANGWYVFNASPTSGSVRVVEGYFESVVPLAKDMMFAKSINVDGAVRETNYNTSGDVTTWKVSGVWDVVDSFRVRATRSRDIRAPNTQELFSPLLSSQTTVNGNLTPIQSGGNASLRPETADTTTVGAVLRPTWGWTSGFRLSVDHYDIKVHDAITTLTAQLIVDRCRQGAADYCQLVSFLPNGSPGLVKTLFLNLNELDTSGYDFEAAYRLPLSKFSETLPGRLDFSVLATKVDHLTAIDSTHLKIDRAGQTGSSASGGGVGVPDWTVNSTVTYSNGPFSGTVETRYINSGLFDATLIGPDQAGFAPTLANGINYNHVASRFYVNLFAQYDLWVKDGRKVQVYGAVRNLFDLDPPVAPSNQGATNNVLFDVVGRSFRLGVRFNY